MWICFCYLYGANLIKTYLQACNLQTSWSISYKSVNQFLIEFAPFEFAPSKSQTKSTLNVKKISHFQMKGSANEYLFIFRHFTQQKKCLLIWKADIQTCSNQWEVVLMKSSGLPKAEVFSQSRRFSLFNFWLWPPKFSSKYLASE